MNELSHSELQKWHYQSLKNPLYVLDGRMDIFKEEQSYYQPLENPKEKTKKIIVADDARYILQRLNEIERKLNTHIYKRKNKTTKYKGINAST